MHYFMTLIPSIQLTILKNYHLILNVDYQNNKFIKYHEQSQSKILSQTLINLLHSIKYFDISLIFKLNYDFYFRKVFFYFNLSIFSNFNFIFY